MAGRLKTIRLSEERGASLVEAALILPLLVMLTVGIWASARAWNVHNTLDHAAREAARYGATEVPWDGTSAAAVRAVADQELTASAINPVDVATVCIAKGDAGSDPCGLGSTSAPQVSVVIEWQNYPLDFVFFSINVDMRASAVSRWEGS
jgi:Flp pilus assembly protein TadG